MPLLKLSGYPSQQSHLYSLRLVYEFLTVESLCATVIFVVVYEPLLSFRFRDPKTLNMNRSSNLNKRAKTENFPDPLGPASATFNPASICKLKLRRTFTSGRSGVLNAGVSTPMKEMTTGMNVYNSVIEGTAREKIWYDLMPSSKVA
ncbi:hypothetical protein Peur_034223 [Populus x canadensis]